MMGRALLLCLLSVAAFAGVHALSINEDTPIESLPADPNVLAEMLMSSQGASDQVSKIVDVIIKNVKRDIDNTNKQVAESRCEAQREGFVKQIRHKLETIRDINDGQIKRDLYVNNLNARVGKLQAKIDKKAQVIANLVKDNALADAKLDYLKNAAKAASLKINNTLAGIKIIRDAVVAIKNNEKQEKDLKPLPKIKASLMELSAFTSKLSGSTKDLIQAAIDMASKADPTTGGNTLDDLIRLLDQIRDATLAERKITKRKFKVQKRGMKKAISLRKKQIEFESRDQSGLKDSISRAKYDLADKRDKNTQAKRKLELEQKEVINLKQRLSNVVSTCTELQKISDAKLKLLNQRLKDLEYVKKLIAEKLAKGELSPAVEKMVESATTGTEAPLRFRYTGWGPCSVTCGAGTKKRGWTCTTLTGEGVDNKRCEAQLGKPITTKVCKRKQCSVNCKLSDYVQWSACPAKCKKYPSQELYRRGRKQIARPASGGGKKCTGQKQVSLCPGLELCDPGAKFKSFSLGAKDPSYLTSPVSLGHMPFTFSAWIKPFKDGYGIIFAKESCKKGRKEKLRLQIHKDGLLALVTNNMEVRFADSTSPRSKDWKGGFPEFVSYKTIKADDNRAFHVMLTRKFHAQGELNGSDQYTYKLFINGVLQKTAKIVAKSSWNTRPLTIGAKKCKNGKVAGKFQGVIADAKFWEYRSFNQKDAKILAEQKPLGI